MSVQVLNLRSFTPGEQPLALQPGQVCYNMADKIIYIGNGSNFKTDFTGTSNPGVAGQGWFSFPLTAASNNPFLISPNYYGGSPTNGQVPTWNAAQNRLVWGSGGGGGGGSVDSVTAPVGNAITVNNTDPANPVVSVRTGSTTQSGVLRLSDSTTDNSALVAATANAVKITYQFAGTKVSSPLVAGTINQVLALTDPGTGATAWVTGGGGGGGSVDSVSGTSPITVNNTDPVNPVVGINAASTSVAGAVQLSAATNSTSTTLAATASAVKSAYDVAVTAGTDATQALADALAAQNTANSAALDATQAQETANTAQGDATQALADAAAAQGDATQALADAAAAQATADAALPKAGGTMTGDIVFAGTQPTATTTTAGIVVLETSVTSTDTTKAATPSSVKTAYDLANAALPLSGGTMTGVITFAEDQTLPVGDIQDGTLLQKGVVRLSNATDSTSDALAATPSAVKSAYDAAGAAQTTADNALPKAGGTMTGDIVFNSGQTFPVAGIQDATDAQKGVVQVGTNIDVENGVISVADATTGAKGVVQLNDTTNSTSTAQAATANAVKTAYDLANAALPKAGGTMSGDIAFNASQTFPVAGIQDATTSAKGVVQVGTNIDVSSGTISVKSSSTSQSGVVQLVNTVTSTSTTEALTAAQGKALQDQIDNLVITSNLTLAGTIDGSTGLLVTVTGAGAALVPPFVPGAALPAAAAGNAEFFVIVTVNGTMTPTGGTPTLTHVGDWFLSDGAVWQFLDVGYQPGYASTTFPGVIQLATQGEVDAGTDATKAVTPATLSAAYLALAGGTMAGQLNALTVNIATGESVTFNNGEGGTIEGISDSVSTTSSVTAASSTAVKSAYDLADDANTLAGDAVPKSAYATKGDLLAATGASAYSALSIGTNNQVLSANSACATGLQWVTPYSAPNATPSVAGLVLGCTETVKNNVALGTGMFATLTGADNVAIGCAPLAAITTGCRNVAIGDGTACSLTTGNSNLAIGSFAMAFAAGASSDNVAIGGNALLDVNGSGNTAIGAHAGEDLQTGSRNLLLGYEATVGDGDCQMALSFAVGQNWLTGDSSKHIQPGAGLRDTAGNLGTAGQVLSSTGTAIEWITNAADGVQSVSGTLPITIDNENPADPIVGVNTATPTALGVVFASTEDGENPNTGVGFSANNALTTGIGNVALGACSGNATSGNYNVAVGFGAAVTDATANCQLVIAPNSTASWLTGDSAMNIKPGAGILDGLGTVGAAGQVLSSTGSALEWITPGDAPAGGVAQFANFGSFPALGVPETLYVALDTGISYYWLEGEPSGYNVVNTKDGTLLVKGSVQLSDATNTATSTVAATDTAVKAAYDLAAAAMPISGGTFSGEIFLNGSNPIPSSPESPTSKFYVDQISGGLRPQDAVRVATTVAIPGVVTYNNGTAGVGATLTLGTALATIDGVARTGATDRVLVKNQASAFQNGVYVWTTTTLLTRASNADSTAELPNGALYFVSNGTTNGGTSYAQYTTVNTIGTDPISYTRTSGANFHKYSKEWNVDPVGGDDTNGTGSEEQPFLTIGRALTAAGNTGERIVLHQGTYTENLTIGATDLNLDIVGANRSGATINGTVAFTGASSSVRVSGVLFFGNITHSGAGGVYLDECTLNTGVVFTKSGNGYSQFFDVEANLSSLNITGAGYFNVDDSRIGPVTINNAAGVFSASGCPVVGAVTLTLGTTVIDTSNVFATGETNAAVTSALGTTAFLRNSQFYTPSGAAARLNLNGSFILDDSTFDKANSLLEGALIDTPARFGSIDLLSTVSSLSLAGPITLPSGVGAAGQVLTSNGPGSPLTWTAGGGGGGGTVDTVAGVAPVTVNSTDPANVIVSVSTGSTSEVGVLQLTNSVASTSATTAATPNSVKVAYDLAAAALPKSGGTLTGNLFSTPLQTTSTVTAANQLGVVVDLSTGQLKTVVSFDAGGF